MELDRRSIIRITNSEAFQYAVQQRRNSINSIENLLPIAWSQSGIEFEILSLPIDHIDRFVNSVNSRCLQKIQEIELNISVDKDSRRD